MFPTIEFNNVKIPVDENTKSYLVANGVSSADADAMIANAEKQRELQTVLMQRQQAYKREAEPLFIEFQFDQTPEVEQKWRTKVEEIKARYPKPTA